MSLLNNNKNKNKKKGNANTGSKSAFFGPKANINTKAANRSVKLTGGTNRGS